jgi:hypothetical protein
MNQDNGDHNITKEHDGKEDGSNDEPKKPNDYVEFYDTAFSQMFY